MIYVAKTRTTLGNTTYKKFSNPAKAKIYVDKIKKSHLSGLTVPEKEVYVFSSEKHAKTYIKKSQQRDKKLFSLPLKMKLKKVS